MVLERFLKSSSNRSSADRLTPETSFNMGVLMEQMQLGIRHHLTETMVSDRYRSSHSGRVYEAHERPPHFQRDTLCDSDFKEIRKAKLPQKDQSDTLRDGDSAGKKKPKVAPFAFSAFAPHGFAHFWSQFGVAPDKMITSLCDLPLQQVWNTS